MKCLPEGFLILITVFLNYRGIFGLWRPPARLAAVRVAFFGSPAFALPSLDALLGAGHDVVLVVSQPARPVGRHAAPEDPPVAARARALGLPLWQPESLKGEAAMERLAAPGADLFVVVAYGRILGPRTLSIPPLGCLNVHGSLLPRWRGASPVQAALLAGDVETGVSLMKLDAGMDTGPVYAEARTPVGPGDDAGTLSVRLARMGASLLAEKLPSIASGGLVPVAQQGALATECGRISREDARVDWTLSAETIARRARAFTPWPGLYCERAGRRMKLSAVAALAEVEAVSAVKAVKAEEAVNAVTSHGPPTTGEPPAPGTVLAVGEFLVVACGEGCLAVGVLQAEGKRALPAREFAAGARLVAGERLS